METNTPLYLCRLQDVLLEEAHGWKNTDQRLHQEDCEALLRILHVERHLVGGVNIYASALDHTPTDGLIGKHDRQHQAHEVRRRVVQQEHHHDHALYG